MTEVPDVPSRTVKKKLKTTEKRLLSSTFKNLPAFNLGYQLIRILKQGLEILLAANLDSSL